MHNIKHALVRKGNYLPAVLKEDRIIKDIEIIAKGTLREMIDLLMRWHDECTVEELTDKDYKVVTISEEKAKEFKKALQDEHK